VHIAIAKPYMLGEHAILADHDPGTDIIGAKIRILHGCFVTDDYFVSGIFKLDLTRKTATGPDGQVVTITLHKDIQMVTLGTRPNRNPIVASIHQNPHTPQLREAMIKQVRNTAQSLIISADPRITDGS